MPKMAHSGEKHGEPRLICRGNNLIIADGTSRLNYGRCTRVRRRQ
jgi:hypothetical protein